MTTQPSRSGNTASESHPSSGDTSWSTSVLNRFWPQTGERWIPYTRPLSWWPDVLMLLAVVVVTTLLLWRSPMALLDVALRDWALATRPEWAFVLADIARYVGQGTPLAIFVLGFAVITAWRYRTIRPLLLHVSVLLAATLSIRLCKLVFDRVAPRFPDTDGPPPYIDVDGSLLFSGLDHMSYPSGHAANTAAWYGLIVMLIGMHMSRRWRTILYVAPPAVLVVAQLYTTYHWISDVIAGYLIGLVVIRMIQRVPWGTMRLGPLAKYDRGPITPG